MNASPSTITLLDGATGTELGRRGVDISLPLWSARALLDAPEVIEQVHREYLEAGAMAITANTFRTHRRSLAKAGLGERATALTRQAVEIAQRARDAVNPQALVLGSVAPLEDCYRPELAPNAATCAKEHAAMIAQLLEAGVDRVLIETMNNADESIAAARAASRLAPGRWMLSFCVRNDGPPGALLSGEALSEVIPRALEDGSPVSIGINCVAAPSIEPQVKLLRALVPNDIAVSAYANIGRATPGGDWVCTDAVDPAVFADYAARWIAAGATIIGGCCGTTPSMIRALAETL